MRDQPGQHLNQAGVVLARRVGENLGRFERVITSTLPRAFETAIAMGYAVDSQVELLAQMSDEVNAEMQWPQSFARIAELYARGGAVTRFATEQARIWRAIAAALSANGRALMISHGGIVEAGMIGCLPSAEHRAWGDALGYCEGARLQFDGEKFGDAEILRVDGAIISNHRVETFRRNVSTQ